MAPPASRPLAAGLTLVELLFAVTILAFALLGVAGMFPSALRSIVSGGHTTKATALAQAMLDVIRTEPFDTLISRYDSFTTTAIAPGNGCPVTVDPSHPDYAKMKWACDLSGTAAQSPGQGLPNGSGSIAVVCVNADGTTNTATPCPTDLRRLTVTVRWDRSSSRSVSLVTHVARTD